MATHLDRQLLLLETERQYAIDQTLQEYAALDATTLQKRGVCMLNMRISGMRTGLGGKTCVPTASSQ
jgi:DNA polymerase alpha-associated DNA helicase A